MVRITGGEFRGRFLETPRAVSGKETTRPTQSRLRQALFNSIQTVIGDSEVLDLFAGSGALGFEALSRGASRVTFVEELRPVCKLIERNARELQVEERIVVIPDSVDHFWKKLRETASPFDLVLADPPYEAGWEMRLLEEMPWTELLKPDGHLLIEWGTQKSRVKELPEQTPWLVKVREKNYGDSMLTSYRRPETA